MRVPEPSRSLLEALIDAYPGHVTSGSADWLPVEGFPEAVEEGTRWLRSTLTELLSQPFPDQRRGPLEVFQEAMRFPTGALQSAGVDPVPRDPIAARALPGDLYHLAPASTQEISEEVWAAHLNWGAAKAAAITRGLGRDDGGR